MEVIINGVKYVPKHEMGKQDICDLPTLLVAARSATGESLQKAADAIGTSKPHLHAMEQGNSCNPTLEILRGMVAHYGLDPKDVLGG